MSGVSYGSSHGMHQTGIRREDSKIRMLLKDKQDEAQQQLNGPEMDVLVRHDQVEIWENEIEYRLSV